MVDRGHSRLGGVQGARLTFAMHGDARLQACRLGDGLRQLRLGVLDDGVKLAVLEEVAAGFVNLDEVRPVLDLLANDGHQFIAGVGVGGVGEHVLLGVVVERVLVAAEDVDGVAADAQARSGDLSLVNGVADGGVGRPRAFRTHVALGSEAGQQVGFGSQSGHDHPLGYGLHHGLKIFRSGMEEEMHVGVDQAGHQRRVAQIDGLRSGGMGDGRAGGNDLLSFDQDLPGGKHAAAFDIEQARGMENDGVRWRRSLCQGARRAGRKAEQETDKAAAAKRLVWTMDGQDGLQNISRSGLRAEAYYYWVTTMRLRRKIREVTYNFEDLRDLLAKASPYRSGDALAGIAAESAEQRAAAQMTLADLPLRAFLQQASGALRERRGHPADHR